MKTRQSTEFLEAIVEHLLVAKDYRDFLVRAFATLKEKQPHFSYQSFANRAGFLSKSFARDVMTGKKRITEKSLAGFQLALGLRGEAAEYFALLVAQAEQDITFDQLSPSKRANKLRALHKQLSRRGQTATSGAREKIYDKTSWPYIYAALGTMENGATLTEIVQRVGGDRLVIEKSLREMVSSEVALFDAKSGRYLAHDFHLIYDGEGNQEFFKNYYLLSANAMVARARENFAKKDRLYLNSTFTVRQDRLPELRQKLREVLLSYIEGGEDPEGDRVYSLNLGFAPFTERD